MYCASRGANLRPGWGSSWLRMSFNSCATCSTLTPSALAQIVELQQQAFLQIARGDARRVELLHDLQRLLGDLHRPGAERRYLFERAVKVAVIIEVADDRFGGGGHFRRRNGQAQLPVEVIGQAVFRSQELFE